MTAKKTRMTGAESRTSKSTVKKPTKASGPASKGPKTASSQKAGPSGNTGSSKNIGAAPKTGATPTTGATTRRIRKGPPACDRCKRTVCDEGRDCFGFAEEIAERYEVPDTRKLAKVAAEVEARFYGAATRIEEVVHFAKGAGFKRLGVAFCAGFRAEARIACEMLRVHFEVVSACCKNGGISKKRLGMPNVRKGPPESMCNPLGQAELMNRAKTDLNVIIGLCVGHDALFTKHSDALVTTLVAKDRVLAHNPAAAMMNRYVNRRLREGLFKP